MKAFLFLCVFALVSSLSTTAFGIAQTKPLLVKPQRIPASDRDIIKKISIGDILSRDEQQYIDHLIEKQNSHFLSMPQKDIIEAFKTYKKPNLFERFKEKLKR